MHMLDQQEKGHAEGDQQGQSFVHPARQAEIQQEYRRSVTRKEQVLGDEFWPVEKIAQRVYQADEARRRIQRYQEDRQHPEKAQHDKGPHEGQEHPGALDTPDSRQGGEGPDNDKEGDRNIMRRNQS